MNFVWRHGPEKFQSSHSLRQPQVQYGRVSHSNMASSSTIERPTRTWPLIAASSLHVMLKQSTTSTSITAVRVEVSLTCLLNPLTNHSSVLDARLTDQGRKQASSLVPRIPELQKKADLIVTSPLQRTLQTTLLGWAPAVKRLGLENIICLPEVQGCNDFPW